MLVFLDTEFTDLLNPELLSLGLATLDGREFYAELDVKSHVIISLSAAGPSFAPEKCCTGLSSPFNGSKPHEPYPSSSTHHAQNSG